LQLQDQGKLRCDHWHVLECLQQAGNADNLLAEAAEFVIRAQERKLRAEDEQIELLGVDVFVDKT
jgi:hypothetical protein